MSNYVKTKNVKKASTFVLTTSILMGSVYPAFADTNTSKDEVVYVKLNNNGNVDNVYVVNSFDVKNGDSVLIEATVSVYAVTGYNQLIVKNIEPDGVGSLFLKFENLKKSLLQEGLFDEKYKKNILSLYPKK